MRYKYDYDGTEEGKATAVAAHADLTLVEIQDITEGHFLVFSDTPVTTPSSTSEQLESISSNLLTAMEAIADLDEAVAALSSTTTTTA